MLHFKVPSDLVQIRDLEMVTLLFQLFYSNSMKCTIERLGIRASKNNQNFHCFWGLNESSEEKVEKEYRNPTQLAALSSRITYKLEFLTLTYVGSMADFEVERRRGGGG